MFVDGTKVRVPAALDAPPAPGAWRVLNAHEFLWRQQKGHYELNVYQVGNSHLHKYQWPYLFQYPGLAVLHDVRLHHARAEALLSAGRMSDYRAEFAWSHPDTGEAAANFALLGIERAEQAAQQQLDQVPAHETRDARDEQLHRGARALVSGEQAL